VTAEIGWHVCCKLFLLWLVKKCIFYNLNISSHWSAEVTAYNKHVILSAVTEETAYNKHVILSQRNICRVSFTTILINVFDTSSVLFLLRGHRGSDCMVIGFTTTYSCLRHANLCLCNRGNPNSVIVLLNSSPSTVKKDNILIHRGRHVKKCIFYNLNISSHWSAEVTAYNKHVILSELDLQLPMQ
jgi:hypothetical protein